MLPDLRKMFLTCRQRVERSYEHLQALTEEILAVEEACVRGEMYGIAGEFDSESGYEIHRLKELKPIPFTRWGILVGDVVHQARAALDNLVELLNIRETGHPLRKMLHQDGIFERLQESRKCGNEGFGID